MKMLDNINSTVRDDLQQSIHKGSKLSIAAACFSIHAYQELKKQLQAVLDCSLSNRQRKKVLS